MSNEISCISLNMIKRFSHLIFKASYYFSRNNKISTVLIILERMILANTLSSFPQFPVEFLHTFPLETSMSAIIKFYRFEVELFLESKTLK